MSLGNLIFTLTAEQKVVIRKIEKPQRKREKAKNAVIFNKTCLQEYIYIYAVYMMPENLSFICIYMMPEKNCLPVL